MYIYRIYNIETNESYIGQTVKDITYRFKEHIREAKRSLRGEKREFSYFHRLLLYCGVENFAIELLEEVSDSLADEREIYWIEYYNSYYQGYNSTKGGQNRPRGELVKESNDKWGDVKAGGMPIQEVIEKGLYNPYGNNNAGKKVGQFNLQGELINTYSAASVASKETGISASGIRKTCNGQQKKSGGYVWKWMN